MSPWNWQDKTHNRHRIGHTHEFTIELMRAPPANVRSAKPADVTRRFAAGLANPRPALRNMGARCASHGGSRRPRQASAGPNTRLAQGAQRAGRKTQEAPSSRRRRPVSPRSLTIQFLNDLRLTAMRACAVNRWRFRRRFRAGTARLACLGCAPVRAGPLSQAWNHPFPMSWESVKLDESIGSFNDAMNTIGQFDPCRQTGQQIHLPENFNPQQVSAIAPTSAF